MINKVFGPPGTGKTTLLISTLTEFLSQGVQPNEIGYVSFTRKAADEAKDRSSRELGLMPSEMEFFRTIHSFCFYQLGLNRSQVLKKENYQELCDTLGLPMSGSLADDGSFQGMQLGDRIIFTENLSRSKCIPLKQAWEEALDDEMVWEELERFQRSLQLYKDNKAMLDYTDMLDLMVDHGAWPQFKALFVDEAQDLSLLQWKVVNKMIENSEVIYVAGDDDQAIYRWAGADSRVFLELQGDTRVLNQSYRIPASVHKIAESIINGITGRRQQKHYRPRDDYQGTVQRDLSIEDIDISRGTWLLLARNGYQLRELERHCLRSGIPYSSKRPGPTEGGTLNAIRLWTTLQRGGEITHGDMESILKFIPKTHYKKPREIPDGPVTLRDLRSVYSLHADGIWHRVLTKIPPVVAEFFIAALRGNEKLTQTPRIKISTIHGVKGGEADNVALMTDLSPKTYYEMQRFWDDEHRVFYVAVTRAKQNLHIISPQSQYGFDI